MYSGKHYHFCEVLIEIALNLDKKRFRYVFQVAAYHPLYTCNKHTCSYYKPTMIKDTK